MKKIFGKVIVFSLFIFLIFFLSQQTRVDNQRQKVKKASTGLLGSLESAKNELQLVLGEDETLKKSINDLKLSYDGCGSDLLILPDFIYNKKSNAIEVCNISLLNKTVNFHQRIIYEFITNHKLCLNPVNDVLDRICDDRDQNKNYTVNRFMASSNEKPQNLMTLNMEYGDKSSVFMVITGKQDKLAFKTNYGDERIVQLADEDVKYLSAQLEKVKRKFSKPKCNRKVIRLFAQNKIGQRFRSFACVEDLDKNTQALLKLTRTVSSLSQNTF